MFISKTRLPNDTNKVRGFLMWCRGARCGFVTSAWQCRTWSECIASIRTKGQQKQQHDCKHCTFFCPLDPQSNHILFLKLWACGHFLRRTLSHWLEPHCHQARAAQTVIFAEKSMSNEHMEWSPILLVSCCWWSMLLDLFLNQWTARTGDPEAVEGEELRWHTWDRFVFVQEYGILGRIISETLCKTCFCYLCHLHVSNLLCFLNSKRLSSQIRPTLLVLQNLLLFCRNGQHFIAILEAGPQIPQGTLRAGSKGTYAVCILGPVTFFICCFSFLFSGTLHEDVLSKSKFHS